MTRDPQSDLARVSDRALVLELCKRLKLSQRIKGDILASDGCDLSPDCIEIGSGDGYSGFKARFYFDGDTLTGHGVWE